MADDRVPQLPPELPRRMRTSSADDSQRNGLILGGVIMGLVFTMVGVPLAELIGVPSGLRFIAIPLFGGAMGCVLFLVARAIVNGAGRGFGAFVQPSGQSTPYARTYSAHQALVASAQYDEAFAAYERTAAQEPANIEIRRQAAELHARHGDPRRAEALYLEIRRLAPRGGGEELMATQRLVDLYLGALGDDGRAQVELRRLAERFPGTRESDGARVALTRLKENQQRDPD